MQDQEVWNNGYTCSSKQDMDFDHEFCIADLDIPISIAILGGDIIPNLEIYVTQCGEAIEFANGATPWYGSVNQVPTIE
jgi:hypothetical protein